MNIAYTWKTQGLCYVDTVEEHINWAEGAVFLQPSIRCNYKWPRAEGRGSQSDLGSHVNLRPTVSWLWQQDFTSIIQIPKQSNLHFANSNQRAVFTRRHMEERYKKTTESNRAQWMNPPSQWINRGHNHTLMQTKQLADIIFAIHSTLRHIPNWLCPGFITDRGVFS